MPIKAIVFDLFDVLIRAENFQEWQQLETHAGLPRDGLAKIMFRSPLFKESLMGHVPEMDLWQDVATRLGMYPYEWANLAGIYYSAFKMNRDLAAFLRILRSRYQVALLSNAPNTVRDWLTSRWSFDKEVDLMVLSCEEGVLKPDPHIYWAVLGKLGVAPEQAIFIDDEPRFVEGARKVGMNGIQFKETMQTVAEIKRQLGR